MKTLALKTYTLNIYWACALQAEDRQLHCPEDAER